MKKLILISFLVSLNAYSQNLKIPGRNVDVLFVVDNSGSMETIQKNVILNSKIFFDQFARQAYLNWKIGIISTDKADRPYIGFETSFDWSLFDYRDPHSIDQAVSEFQQSILNLGVAGSAQEYVFYNIKRNLENFDGKIGPQFLRPDADLVVVMITDEIEQSERDFGVSFNAQNFLDSLKKLINEKQVIRFYGALNREDLKDCSAPIDIDPYKGSPFESIVNLTNGFTVSACTNEFGLELAKIGKDIATLNK